VSAIAVGLNGPARALGSADLVAGQLARGRAHQHRSRVGRGIPPPHLPKGSGGRAAGQGPPAAHSDRTVLAAERRVCRRPAFGSLRARLPHRPMPRGAPALARAVAVRGRTPRDVLAPAPAPRGALRRGPHLLQGSPARLPPAQALGGALGHSSNPMGHRRLARGAQARAPHPAAALSPQPDDGCAPGDQGGWHCPRGALAVPCAQPGAPRLGGPPPRSGRGSTGSDGPPLWTPGARARRARTPRSRCRPEQTGRPAPPLPRSRARSPPCHPQRR